MIQKVKHPVVLNVGDLLRYKNVGDKEYNYCLVVKLYSDSVKVVHKTEVFNISHTLFRFGKVEKIDELY